MTNHLHRTPQILNYYNQRNIGSEVGQSSHHSKSSKYHFVYAKESSKYFPIVQETFKKVIAPIYGDQTNALNKIKDQKDRKCEILTRYEEPIGLLVYKKEKQNEFQKEGIKDSFEIKTLFVINPEKNSGKGYGTMLINRVHKLAKRIQAKNIHVTVSDVAKNKSFFEKKGFSVVKTWHGKYQPNINEYLMHLPLSKIVNRDSKNKVEERKSKKRTFEDTKEKGLYEKRTLEHSESQRKRQKRNEHRPQNTNTFVPNKFYIPPIKDTGRNAVHKKHTLTLRKKYIHQIRSGKKTIEGRIHSGVILKYRPGDQIRFFYQQNPSDDVVCNIIDIKKYASFREMLKQEGFQRCLTDVKTFDEAVQVYNQIPGYAARAARSGVAAIKLAVSK